MGHERVVMGSASWVSHPLVIGLPAELLLHPTRTWQLYHGSPYYNHGKVVQFHGDGVDLIEATAPKTPSPVNESAITDERAEAM